ncbi:hypothetical protein [Pseudomonas brassicacearum]|uniref:hypothetical protein n=1 Tax=Pseudomonas brassicacearum TaxID=930166 RepID=UPI0015E75FA6|nr:hypothetical protein [Pseudomonas brassicacearum]
MSLPFIVEALHGGGLQIELAWLCNAVEQRLPTSRCVGGHYPGEEDLGGYPQLSRAQCTGGCTIGRCLHRAVALARRCLENG